MKQSIPKQNQCSDSIEFLLSEYSEIFEEFRRVRTEGVQRLNFFVTLTSGVLGGLAILSQLTALNFFIFQILGIFLIAVLILFGWEVFRYLVSRDINSDFNMRAMGRIRRYFVEKDPEITNYLLWSSDDEPYLLQQYRTLSSLIVTMIYLMGILITLDTGMILSISLIPIKAIIAIGVIVFLISIYLLRIYAKKRINMAYAKALKISKFKKIYDTNDDV